MIIYPHYLRPSMTFVHIHAKLLLFLFDKIIFIHIFRFYSLAIHRNLRKDILKMKNNNNKQTNNENK